MRFYEDWGAAEGGLWATVTAIRQDVQLELTGPIGMSGVVHGVARFDLEQREEGTLLKLSHRAIGDVNEQTEMTYTQGWSHLLATRLRAFVEAGTRYGLGHEPPA